jgi:hypothetical protein
MQIFIQTGEVLQGSQSSYASGRGTLGTIESI